MKCPECGSENTGCIDSRNGKKNRRRRYICKVCGGRFSTYEIYADELRASAAALEELLAGTRRRRNAR